MNSIKKLLNGFFKRSGSLIFLATIIARVSNLLVSLIVLKLIAKDTLGVVLYAMSFIAFLIPITGLGIQQSLVRYGAFLKTKHEKNILFLYTLKKGFLVSVLFVFSTIIFGYFYPFKFEKAQFYFTILSFSLIAHFLLLVLKIYYRLHHNNRTYAIIEIIYAIVFIILSSVLSFFLKDLGYALSLVLTPFSVFLVFFIKERIDFSKYKKPSIVNFAFWRYGFFAALGYVTTLLLFEIDKILIGNILDNPIEVTNYSYLALVPISLRYLPVVLITADYVYLTENILDKKYIFNYIKSYLQIFTIISILLIIGSYLFVEDVLALIDSDFAKYSNTFLVLIIGVSGILIFRGLFNNLLSSIGKAEINFLIAVIAIIINIVSNYYFIPKYGILGAAMTSAIIMWITGLLTFLFFFYYYFKILKVGKLT